MLALSNFEEFKQMMLAYKRGDARSSGAWMKRGEGEKNEAGSHACVSILVLARAQALGVELDGRRGARESRGEGKSQHK